MQRESVVLPEAEPVMVTIGPIEDAKEEIVENTDAVGAQESQPEVEPADQETVVEEASRGKDTCSAG